MTVQCVVTEEAKVVGTQKEGSGNWPKEVLPANHVVF